MSELRETPLTDKRTPIKKYFSSGAMKDYLAEPDEARMRQLADAFYKEKPKSKMSLAFRSAIDKARTALHIRSKETPVQKPPQPKV